MEDRFLKKEKLNIYITYILYIAYSQMGDKYKIDDEY